MSDMSSCCNLQRGVSKNSAERQGRADAGDLFDTTAEQAPAEEKRECVTVEGSGRRGRRGGTCFRHCRLFEIEIK